MSSKLIGARASGYSVSFDVAQDGSIAFASDNSGCPEKLALSFFSVERFLINR